MTESALDKHRLTQIQWHLCTHITKEEEMHKIMKISIEMKNKEIIKSDVFIFTFVQLQHIAQCSCRKLLIPRALKIIIARNKCSMK